MNLSFGSSSLIQVPAPTSAGLTALRAPSNFRKNPSAGSFGQ